MAGSAIKIAILANASQAKREFADVQSRGQKFGKAINAGAKFAAGGMLLLGAAAIKAGKAAAEDEASQSKLAQTLKTAAGATKGQIATTESWITAQGKALGVTDDELRPAIAKLVVATGDVGKAQKLASIAMNVSAGSGKDLGAVTQALAKAQATGSVTALSKYGVATKDATGKTRSLADVTKDLAEKYQGAASKAAETTAGKQKILTVQLGELQEQIGAKLLPVMAKLATAGLAAVSWASKHGTAAKILLGVMVGLAATLIAVSLAMKVGAAAQAIWTAVTVTASAVTKAAAAAQWLLNAAMLANPIGLVILAIVALVAVFVIAWKKSETFRNVVIGAWNAIKVASVAVFNFLKGFITAVWGAIKTVITTYVKVYVAVIKAAWNAIRAVTSAVWNGIKAVVSAVVRFFVSYFRTQFNIARTIITAAWTAIRSATVAIWNGIKTVVRNAVTALLTVVRSIKGKIIGIFSGAGTWLLNAGKKIIDGLLGPLRAGAEKVKGVLRGITDKIPDWKGPAATDAKLLTPAGVAIMESLVRGFDNGTPLVKKKLQALTKDISAFSASPTAEVKLSAAAAYESRVAASSDAPLSVKVQLSAREASQLQRGREIDIDLRAYRNAVGAQ